MPRNNPDSGATQKITIQSAQFTIPLPYVAGACELTQGEADALNQTFAENIRNNFASQMKRAAEDEANPRALTQDDLDGYVEDYAFGQRRTSGPRDPVGTEERRLSVAAAKGLVAKKGVEWKSLSEEKQDEIVEKIIASGQLRAKAEEIVAARQAAAAVQDIDLGLAA